MSESLLARACKVVEAGVGSVVDTAERLTGPALMRQAVRDLQGAADQLRDRQRRATRCADEAERRAGEAAERAEALREEARFALVAGRDDLAQAAVVERQRAQEVATRARAQAARARDEAETFGAAMADATARHRAAEAELRAQISAVAPGRAQPTDVGHKIDVAERRFARAAAAVSGCAPDAPNGAAGVAEIGTMRRDAAVAAELAALKDTMDPPAQRGRRSGR